MKNNGLTWCISVFLLNKRLFFGQNCQIEDFWHLTDHHLSIISIILVFNLCKFLYIFSSLSFVCVWLKTVSNLTSKNCTLFPSSSPYSPSLPSLLLLLFSCVFAPPHRLTDWHAKQNTSPVRFPRTPPTPVCLSNRTHTRWLRESGENNGTLQRVTLPPQQQHTETQHHHHAAARTNWHSLSWRNFTH